MSPVDPVSDKELFEAFMRDYPNDLLQVSRTTLENEPYDTEAITATAIYQKVPWEHVNADMLKKHYDITLLFSPDAFHYFFPAFIRLSQINFEKLELFADTLVFFMSDSNDDWSMRRWAKFSKEQLELALKWLNWVSRKENFSGAASIPKAIENIKLMER